MARFARRYPLTALGCASALGVGVEATRVSLGHAAVRLASAPFALPFEACVGMLPPEFRAQLGPTESRVAQLAALSFDQVESAVKQAVERRGGERVGVIVGSSNGGLDLTERALTSFRATGTFPAGYHLPTRHSPMSLVAELQRRSGARGPAMALSTTCSSSAKALCSAKRWLDSELVDAVLVVGAESLSPSAVLGFHSLGILAPDPCRPFGEGRRGLNLGEGSAAILVEREGSAAVALCGVGESSDAHHATAPHPEGEGALRAMHMALADAALAPADIDHVNAHGTGTPLNDSAEGKAIAALLGNAVPVVSTKGYTGHLLGAGGAVEAVIAALCITHGAIPASAGAAPVDSSIAVRVNLEPVRAELRHVLSNSFAFGGSNASVILGRFS